MPPQLGVIAACLVFTAHHFCVAYRHSVNGKEDDLVVEKSDMGGEGESHDEAPHTVKVQRQESWLEVGNVGNVDFSGDEGHGEGTTAMASIVRTALELFPEPDVLDDQGRWMFSPLPRVRLKSSIGSDWFWTLMGMAPDIGILTHTTSESLVRGLARRYLDCAPLQQLMWRAFGIDVETVTPLLLVVDLGSHTFPDPTDFTNFQISKATIPEKLLLAAFWYAVRVGEPSGWTPEPDAGAVIPITAEGKLAGDLSIYINEFRSTDPEASVADVVASMGSYNYVTHEFVPQVLKKLREKASAAPGAQVRLEIGLEFHLSPEGRKRWTEAFETARERWPESFETGTITANREAINSGETLAYDQRDTAAKLFFRPFHDLQHLHPWMTHPQQQLAQELAMRLKAAMPRTLGLPGFASGAGHADVLRRLDGARLGG